MKDDGSADIVLLVEHCRSLLDLGCSSVLLLGTTGEANSFTNAERRAILEGVLAGGIAAEKLIVGTGCSAIGDTVGLSKHALSLGVTRVLVLPPFYYKLVSDEGLFGAFAATVEQINDDRLQMLLYLIPQLTGIELHADLVEKIFLAYPKNVVGLKDSSGNWPATQTLCRRLGDKIDVLVGTEALLLRAMQAGASGCISATANATAQPIIELFIKRDRREAATLEEGVLATRAAFESFPVIPALKAYLARKTGQKSWRNVRPPLCALTQNQTEALIASLVKAPQRQEAS
jgi:4-hydroxy-tetrahydrodipicolinate synthase